MQKYQQFHKQQNLTQLKYATMLHILETIIIFAA
jgi:hypothetical protein